MKNKLFILAGVAAFILLLIPIVSYFSVFNGGILLEQDKWGEFGDYFGGILNPLFALLAFFGVLYSISFQREEFEKTTGTNKGTGTK